MYKILYDIMYVNKKSTCIYNVYICFQSKCLIWKQHARSTFEKFDWIFANKGVKYITTTVCVPAGGVPNPCELAK
jgi:hypothetical protein